MIALIDETTPEVDGQILYTVVSAVVLERPEVAREEVRAVVGERTRPFHWSQEGPVARSTMVDQIATMGAVGRAMVVPCGRRGQEPARAAALGASVRHLLAEGCGDLIIESRGTTWDGRDRAVILDTLREDGRSGDLRYEWRTKAEPLLWVADAIAGAAAEHLMGRPDRWFSLMVEAAAMEVERLAPVGPKVR